MSIHHEIRRLARLLAPEMGAVGTEVSRDLGCHRGERVAGLARLSERCIAICPCVVSWAAGVGDREYRVKRFAEIATGAIVHELAHFLDHATMTCEQYHAIAAMTLDGPRDNPPWALHEHHFLRGALHLRERAAALGLVISLADLIGDHRRYGISPPELYLDAIGDEPIVRINEPLLTVLADPAPQRLTDLFAADVAAWNDQQES